jgi:hypothetical protein
MLHYEVVDRMEMEHLAGAMKNNGDAKTGFSKVTDRDFQTSLLHRYILFSVMR